jgi:CRP-like cAMP-binding protein
MLENIKKNIQGIVEFEEEELMFFLSLFTYKKLKKNSFFLREGEICNQVAFINKGLIRSFFLIDGREHVESFSLEGDWMTDYASFLVRQRSSFYIQTMEETELFLLSYDSIQKMYSRGKSFERFGRIMAEQLFTISANRSASLLLESPEQRYLKLLKEQPHLLTLIPLKQIASYLGIEAPSLSRIRKRTKALKP